MVLVKMDSSLTTEQGEDFEITFDNFELNKERTYEIALLKASIWYSYHNISSEFGNNQLRYRTSSSASWNNVNFDDGIYGVLDINTKLQSVMKTNGDFSVVSGVDNFNITISPNYQTLRVLVSVSGGYELDFTTSKLRELLGFTSIVVSSTQQGANAADITRGVNSLVLKNSLVKNSYDNGASSNIIYSFVPNVSPGALMDITPNNPVYLDINETNNITRIRFQLQDNQNRIVKLNGEHVFLLFDIREKK